MEGFEFFCRYRRDKQIGVVIRPRCERENGAIIWIHDHDRSAFGLRLQGLFSELLQMQVESRDNGMTGHRRRHDLLRSFATILIERHFVIPVLAGEHGVECLLDSLPTFGLRPNRFVVINDSIRVAAGLAGIADNLARCFSDGINTYVNAAERHLRRQISFRRRVFFFREILCDLERENSAVVVMAQDGVVRESDLAPD